MCQSRREKGGGESEESRGGEHDSCSGGDGCVQCLGLSKLSTVLPIYPLPQTRKILVMLLTQSTPPTSPGGWSNSARIFCGCRMFFGGLAVLCDYASCSNEASPSATLNSPAMSFRHKLARKPSLARRQVRQEKGSVVCGETARLRKGASSCVGDRQFSVAID